MNLEMMKGGFPPAIEIYGDIFENFIRKDDNITKVTSTQKCQTDVYDSKPVVLSSCTFTSISVPSLS